MAVIARVLVLALAVWAVTAALSWVGFSPPAGLVRARTAAAPPLQLDLGASTRLAPGEVARFVALFPAEAAKLGVATRLPVGPPQPILWAHVATVVSETDRYVVLRADNGDLKTVHEHEKLPSGEQLLAVRAREVVVRSRTGKNVEIKTYVE